MQIPSVYNFIQKIDYPVLLAMSIRAAGISIPFDHIDTLGSGPAMQVSIWFVDVLPQPDQTILNTIMSSYTNPTNSPQMVAAITTALQSDATLLTVLRTRVVTTLPTFSYGELQGLCTLLGISV